MDRPQAHRLEPPRDRTPPHAALQELATGDQPVLRIGKPRDEAIHRAPPTNAWFDIHGLFNVAFDGHCLIVAWFVSRVGLGP